MPPLSPYTAPSQRKSAPRLLRCMVVPFALCAGACGGAGDAGRPVALQGRVLTDTAVLALPMGIMLVGDSVVVQEAHASPTLRVLDLAGRQVAETGRQGAGPGEFSAPTDLFGRPGHPSELWVYDAHLARVTAYDLHEAQTGGLNPSREPLALSEPVMVEGPRWLDDSTLVALDGMLEEGRRRFSLYGADGVLRRTVGALPPGDAGIGPFVRQQAYSGKIAVHPGLPQFVLASRFAGRLEVYDRAGARVRRLDVPDEFEPDFSPALDGINMVRGPRFRFGYVDVATAGERIFGLFSGRKRGDADPNHAEWVHVFDWDGRLRRVLRLDGTAVRITVAPDGKTLYAVGHIPRPRVVVYDLSSVSF